MGRALAQAGHGVRVIGTYPAGHPGLPYEEDAGVRIWRLRAPSYRYGWIQGRADLFRRIAAWARAGEIDLVEVADWQGAAAGWPRLPVPVVARLNGSQRFFADELRRPLGRVPFWLERASLHRADAWCSASEYVARRTAALFGLTTAPGAILYNPVELPPLPAVRPERSPSRIVFTGTLTPKKGVQSLVQAWNAVNAARPDAELHLYGKDGVTESGESMTAALRRALSPAAVPSVTFHGHVARETIFDAVSTARGAAFPSHAEAFGIAPFEAMARGCPTIYTTRQPGPELVQDGVDGLLVDPDRPDLIAEALLRILVDDDLAAQLGGQGRARVASTYSIERLLPQNELFYQATLTAFHSAHCRPRNVAASAAGHAA
jgi:glycosyltransferase involved in cell wall biosynthesis